MPKLKVDHILSFSSEDPAHIANNILSNESSKKWKCKTAGEKSSTIILQLEKASIISGIDIGNENSAYIEILVNRSSSTNDFKVLVVMSSFMTPLESRQGTNPNKVRMFNYADLRSPERDEKWDRVKIVCTQPFNRRVQYGLSFVTLHSSDSKHETIPSETKIGNFTLRAKSPENLSVGNLFARRKELSEDVPLTAAAAIREASTITALSHGSPKYKAKLKDLAPSSNNGETSTSDIKTPSKPRNRNELLYNQDEETPNSKIDKLIDQKNKEKKAKELKVPSNDIPVTKEKKINDGNTWLSKQDQHSNKQNAKAKTSTGGSRDLDKNKRKLNSKDTPHKKAKPNRITKPFNELLSGVTIVISGIENPERSTIRNEALLMGAKYKKDWDGHCTHLICAFTNTPKFAQVKGKGHIVNRMWINDCHSERKRLPWRRYALDSNDQRNNESEDEIWEKKELTPEPPVVHTIEDNSSDTEDEIERIRASEQVNNTSNIYSVETDEENSEIQLVTNFIELPDFFSSKVLYIDKELSESTTALLARYITAYNGLLMDDPSDIIQYAIATPNSARTLETLCPEAKIVSPDWIWECHNAKKLVPDDCYRL